MDVERYTELQATGNDGSVERWSAVDSLTRERVSLWTTRVADSNARAMLALRAEASRLDGLGIDARVFEDLRQGLLGLAFGGPRTAGPTHPQTRTSAAPPSPASTAPLHAPIRSAPTFVDRAHLQPGPPPPTTEVLEARSRAWVWSAFAILFVASAATAAWLALRPPGDPQADEADDDDAAPARPRPTGTPKPASTSAAVTPLPTEEPAATSTSPTRDCGGDVAISSGCIDRAPITEATARACTSCPSRSTDDAAARGDHARVPDALADLDACRDRPAPADGAAATCVSYAFARALCAAQGGRLPTRAEWDEGSAAGMTAPPRSSTGKPTFEWSADAVGETMHYTRGSSGGSQMRRTLRSPTLGLRCVR